MGTGAGCFPEGAMVYTEKGPRDITTIRIGDKVLSASDDGKMIYSEVCNVIHIVKLLITSLIKPKNASFVVLP